MRSRVHPAKEAKLRLTRENRRKKVNPESVTAMHAAFRASLVAFFGLYPELRQALQIRHVVHEDPHRKQELLVSFYPGAAAVMRGLGLRMPKARYANRITIRMWHRLTNDMGIAVTRFDEARSLAMRTREPDFESLRTPYKVRTSPRHQVYQQLQATA